MPAASRQVAVPAAVRRAYGELDGAEVVAALRNLASRVGVHGVTMRELAAELGAAVPSVYYHVPGKRAALELLGASVLDDIPEPRGGRWDARLTNLYCEAREVILSVPGVAGILQTSGETEAARRLDRLSRSLIAEAGLAKSEVAAAHAVLYTYLLGSVSLEESRRKAGALHGKRQGMKRFRAGLQVIVAGIESFAQE
ncbi:TetR family transcriptional regulator [Mycobacterium sp. 050134]|uniref:TetR family transcriptional regulator n=1 Tax=Mycobacterium sp. 050134 TaxID=3096111 RepID=UPI002EDB56D1